jgi:hypothetical protein
LRMMMPRLLGNDTSSGEEKPSDGSHRSPWVWSSVPPNVSAQIRFWTLEFNKEKLESTGLNLIKRKDKGSFQFPTSHSGLRFTW